VEAIRKIRTPQTVKEVRAFLGAVGYYRKFIPEFARITEPLTALTRKGRRFDMNAEAVNSLERCKKAISDAPVLAFPDLSKPFIVTTDASQVALGAVLSQDAEGGDKPVAFASRKLTDAEGRYSAIERELLGIVWAIEQFRPYVFAKDFLLRTDHMPLIWVQKLKETSSRVAKWKERLAGYNFKIIHVKGKDNVVADLLSRNVGAQEVEDPDGQLPVLGGQEVEEVLRELEGDDSLTRDLVRIWTENDAEEEEDLRRLRGGEEEDGNTHMKRSSDVINGKRNQIILRKGQRGDISTEHSRYGPIRRVLITIGPEAQEPDIVRNLKQLLHRGKTYHALAREDSLKEKLIEIYEAGRVGDDIRIILCEKEVETVEDGETQRELIMDYHLGKTNHRGREETSKQLRRRYFWLNMDKTIKDTLSNCQVCGVAKYDRLPYRPPQQETPTPQRQGEVLEADVFFYDHEKYLTALDLLSKRAAVFRIENKSGQAVENALLKVFGLMGCPKVLIVDRGREFFNERVRVICNEMEVKLHFTTPGHVGSHGAIERFHNTLTEHIHLLEAGRGIVGEAAIVRAVVAYNHSIHSVTGQTPIELVNGEGSEEVRENVQKEKQERVKKFNEREADKTDEMFKVGDVVFLKNLCKRLKTDRRFVGPFRIIKVLSRQRVWIQQVQNPSRISLAHIKEIKRK
jgi:transposase InsO family protein